MAAGAPDITSTFTAGEKGKGLSVFFYQESKTSSEFSKVVHLCLIGQNWIKYSSNVYLNIYLWKDLEKQEFNWTNYCPNKIRIMTA